MSATITSDNKSLNLQRPLGVWILTIYALIFAGFFPLWDNYISFIVSGNIIQLLGGNWTVSVFLGVLCVSIIFVSAMTWLGKDNARELLLALITLYYVFIGINSLSFINSSGFIPYITQIEDKFFQFTLQLKWWLPVLGGIIHPAIYIWYFNRHSTKAFYGLDS